jgi:hypothetical protein
MKCMTFRFAAMLPLILLAISCSSSGPEKKADTKPAEPPKPKEPVAARKAFYQTYASARIWSTDATPLEMISLNIPEMPCVAGKCGAWRVVYVSPAKQKAKVYTYGVVESPGNVYEGVFSPSEESWAGPHGEEQPWLTAALKIDSDEAHKTAAAKNEAFLKKNPKSPEIFNLKFLRRYPNLTWRVIWGENASTGFGVFVDATTGAYIGR